MGQRNPDEPVRLFSRRCTHAQKPYVRRSKHRFFAGDIHNRLLAVLHQFETSKHASQCPLLVSLVLEGSACRGRRCAWKPIRAQDTQHQDLRISHTCLRMASERRRALRKSLSRNLRNQGTRDSLRTCTLHVLVHVHARSLACTCCVRGSVVLFCCVLCDSSM